MSNLHEEEEEFPLLQIIALVAIGIAVLCYKLFS